VNFERLTKDELSIALNNSDTSVLFTGARRRQAVNDGQEEFADLTECFLKQSTQACSCNVTEYAISSTDFVRLSKQGVEYLHTDSNDHVTHLSGDSFPRRDLDWRGRYDPSWRTSTTPVKTPSGYYVREEGSQVYIGLNEPPSVGSSETAVLLVPYVAKPVAMTSTGEVPFSSRVDLAIYHKALPLYGAYKLLPLNGDMEGSQAALQTFLGYVARCTQSQRPKGGQHVTVARSYFRESMRRNTGDSDAGPGWARP
jgi:hypothetical protein